MRSRRLCIKAAALSVASVLTLIDANGMAMAQTAQASPPAASPADEQSVQTGLADIVVTAQRRAENLQDVPISISIASSEQIQQSGRFDTSALSSISPSVTFVQGTDASGSSFNIRGVSSLSLTGGIQPSVGLVIDGVSIARQGEFVTDLSDIDRIEILSGPQGTLFGKNSTAGVIQIITKRPEDSFSASVEGTATTDSEYVGRAMVNAPLGNDVAVRVNGYYRKQKALISNLGLGNDVYGEESYGFSGKLSAQLSDNLHFLLSSDYRHRDSTYGVNILILPSSEPLGSAQQAITLVPIQPGTFKVGNDSQNYDRNRGWSVSGQFDLDVSDALSLTSVTAYRDFKYDYNIDIDGFNVGVQRGSGFRPNPTGYPIENIDPIDGRAPKRDSYFSQEIRLNYKADRLDVVGGVYYQHLKNDVDNSIPLILDGAFALQDPSLAGVKFYSNPIVDSRTKDDTASIFGDVTYHVADTLSLIGGLRFNYEKIRVIYHRDEFFNPVTGFFNPVTLENSAPPAFTVDYDRSDKLTNLSGRAGIRWEPSSDQTFYFTYARGYKGPAVDVSYSSTGGATAITKPEIANSFEVGAKLRMFDNKVRLNLAVYAQRIKDIQQTSVVPGTVNQRLQNSGDLRSRGAEASLDIALATGLTFNGGLAYTDATYRGGVVTCDAAIQTQCVGGLQDLTGIRAIGAPKWKGNGGLVYKNDLPSLPVGLMARINYAWVDRIQYTLGNDPDTVEPSHGLLDLTLGVNDDDGRWELMFFVKNLTNDKYYASRQRANFFITRSFGTIGRDYKRYGGVTLRTHF
jgi:iron complex outermembrane receptor protein